MWRAGIDTGAKTAWRAGSGFAAYFSGIANAASALTNIKRAKTWLNLTYDIRVSRVRGTGGPPVIRIHQTTGGPPVLQFILVALHRIFPELQVFQVHAGASCDAGQGIFGEPD